MHRVAEQPQAPAAVRTDLVLPSDTLDVNSVVPAPEKVLANQQCLFGNDFITIKD